MSPRPVLRFHSFRTVSLRLANSASSSGLPTSPSPLCPPLRVSRATARWKEPGCIRVETGQGKVRRVFRICSHQYPSCPMSDPKGWSSQHLAKSREGATEEDAKRGGLRKSLKVLHRY